MFVDHINKESEAWKVGLEPKVDYSILESDITWMQNTHITIFPNRNIITGKDLL